MRLGRHRHSVSRRRVATGRLGAISALLAGIVALGLAGWTEPASADAPIEGVWSFNGGKVAIEAQGDGTFLGTVVAPTKFAQCTHPVGEEMWTELTRQADGSYWGLHQWFFETEDCILNPDLGPTAWRVLQREGERFLRVCFSAPGSGSQPAIAPNGVSTNVTFNCVDSARISALPDLSSKKVAQFVTLPSGKTCLGRRQLRIHVRDPKNDPFAKIVITLRSGTIHRQAKIERRRGGAIATLNLRGVQTPTFVVTARLTTVLGRHLSTRRKYRRCTKKPHQRPHPLIVRHRG